jgi:hypothetical protein
MIKKDLEVVMLNGNCIFNGTIMLSKANLFNFNYLWLLIFRLKENFANLFKIFGIDLRNEIN